MTLFDDFAARFARGERPDARAYLARAGDEADELATLLERYLERAAPPAPSEDAVLIVQAWLDGQPPLLELRAHRGLKRDQVVDALMGSLGLDPAKREKVKGYYHRLETGLLEPRGVDGRVWAALGETLRANLESLRGWRPAPMKVQTAYLRASPPAGMASSPPGSPAAAEAEEPDEIDRLFTSAP